jgi:hypothetical protein
VLVHTHRPTGLILATDGKTPAEDGNQYRPFGNLNEAEQYARAKVENEPLIECAIYSHDKAELMVVRKDSGSAGDNEK